MDADTAINAGFIAFFTTVHLVWLMIAIKAKQSVFIPAFMLGWLACGTLFEFGYYKPKAIEVV
jgi:hypothetical protein